MATFTFRKLKGRYYARISERGRSPRRKSWPLDTTQKVNAQSHLNKLKRAYNRGGWDPWKGGWLSPEPIPLQDSIDAFLADKEHLRPRTQDTYEGILDRFRKRMPPGSMLQDVEADDLKAYIRAPKITSATKHKRFRHLRAFFNWAVDSDRLEASSSPYSGQTSTWKTEASTSATVATSEPRQFRTTRPHPGRRRGGPCKAARTRHHGNRLRRSERRPHPAGPRHHPLQRYGRRSRFG